MNSKRFLTPFHSSWEGDEKGPRNRKTVLEKWIREVHLVQAGVWKRVYVYLAMIEADRPGGQCHSHRDLGGNAGLEFCAAGSGYFIALALLRSAGIRDTRNGVHAVHEDVYFILFIFGNCGISNQMQPCPLVELIRLVFFLIMPLI